MNTGEHAVVKNGHNWLRSVGVSVQMLMTVGALVWGAATLKASIARLEELALELRIDLRSVSQDVKVMQGQVLENSLEIQELQKERERGRR